MDYKSISDESKNTRIFDNILQTIGHTPVVRLNRVPRDHGLECEFIAKCEYLNPGGSIKDRISYTMVVDAVKSGKAKSGTRFVEPTSGNTGIGVSLAAAVCGYDCTIVTPDKNSDEKMSTMALLGSEVVQTPALALYGDPRNFASVAQEILRDDPRAISMDQYSNEVNPNTHYEITAEEILTVVGEFDMIVVGAGTGGTVAGIARKVKEKRPNCIVVAVEPQGSLMFSDGVSKPYFVEGIGGDFIPKVLDKTNIDRVETPNDCQSFNMSRELVRKEGLLCGGSSGAIVYAAIQAAKTLNLGAGKRVVVILPDGIRNYMTKFVTDQWMEANLFKEPPERDYPWWNRSISNLRIDRSTPHINEHVSCKDALAAMGTDHSVALIVNDDGFFTGVISKNSIRSEATTPKRKGHDFDLNDPVNLHTIKTYFKIIENRDCSTVGLASRILDIAPFVAVVEEYRKGKEFIGFIPKGIITTEEVLSFILEHQASI